MKSNLQQLKQRGQFDEQEYNQFLDLSKADLISHLHDFASIRTACIRILSQNYHQDEDYTSILLQQLHKEKALYTKIEIQNQLTQYGDIPMMCQYLGKIGHNQYRQLPAKGSLKKSYPLPRDIIARSLAYISIEKFNLFFDCLNSLSREQLLEAIDALGFLCFYHQELANEETYSFVCQQIEKYSQDDLMMFKLITCLSAFPQSQPLLLELLQTKKHPTLIKEVERSLKIIHQSNNHLN